MSQLPIAEIDQAAKKYFESNPTVRTLPGKGLMAQFIEAGIFTKD